MIDYKEQAADERWRKRSREIMQRDKFTCQLCGKKHVRLNVHHIKYLKGIDYWDYPDELLMTVCEVCHAKIHGKYDKPKKSNNPAKEKFVFYNCLFYEERLQEPTDKIIYSYLVYKSIATMEAAFDSNGDFSYDEIRDELNEDYEYAFEKISYYKIAKDLNISANTVSASLSRLSFSGLFREDDEYFYIYYAKGIKDSFYFELEVDTCLKGMKLIFYSYLKSKSKVYGGIIPQKDYIQYREMNLSRKFYQKLLCELSKDGYMERTKNGKLKVN